MEVKVDNCDNCYNRHITSVAVNWCSNCEESLCSACTEHHHASKLLKSHKLIPISDYHKLPHYIRDVKTSCQIHEEPFLLYCQSHERYCCSSCVEETHCGCKGIKALSDVIKDVKSSPALEDIETSLKTIIGVYDKIRANRLENKSRLPEQTEKIITDVHNIRKKINDHLDNLVKSIEEAISAEFEAAKLKIDEVLTEVEERKKNIRKLIEEGETIKQLSTDLQTFLGLSFFQGRIMEETTYMENLQRNHMVDELDLAFEPSNLDSFCEKNDSLGIVLISHSPTRINFDIGKKEKAQIILPKIEVCDQIVSNIHHISYPKRDFDPKITGCKILPSGQMLFVDKSNSKLFMKSEWSNQEDVGDYRDIICLHDMSDVAVLNNKTVVVTTTNTNQIVIIDILMGKKLKTLTLDKNCWGIEFLDGHLIMKSSGAFLTLDPETGNVVKRLENKCSTSVAACDGKIFGCKHETGLVYCFHADGENLWQFKNKILKLPRALTADQQGFVYVTGKESNNVIVISPDGKTFKEILNQSHGLDAPMAIHFETTLGVLLVCNEKNGALICNIDHVD